METLTRSSPHISTLTADDVAQLASRLEQDDYNNPFEGLNDWHLLRAIAFQRPELVEPYVYLLDLEAYDEA
jgi:type IV secretory pathway ATPase VirB11/archaellum biosynthesis ATPase